MTARDLHARIDRARALAPSGAALRDEIAAVHDAARALTWTERATFAWACDCRRCRIGLRPGGEFEHRAGEVYETGTLQG